MKLFAPKFFELSKETYVRYYFYHNYYLYYQNWPSCYLFCIKEVLNLTSDKARNSEMHISSIKISYLEVTAL